MQNLSTRLKLQVFRDELTECRFLLNLGSGPAEHLGQGIDRARADPRPAGDRPRRATGGADSWVRRLTPGEQSRGPRADRRADPAGGAGAGSSWPSGPGARPTRGRRWTGPSTGSTAPSGSTPTPPPPSSPTGPRYHAALGRADLAAKDRRREAEAVPVSSRDFTLLGSALLARGDLAGAEPALATRRRPRPARVLGAGSRSGTATSSRAAPSTRRATSPRASSLEPRFAWPHLNRGLALAAAGRLAEARASYDRALEANPRFAEAWVNRALADLELNDLAAAERALSRAWELGRRESGVLAVWAEVKARLGRRDEAERLFTRLLRDRPDDPVLLTARGVFRIATDPAGADADLRRALEISPRTRPRPLRPAPCCSRKIAPRRPSPRPTPPSHADRNFLDALQLRALLRARLGDLSAVDDAERLIQVPDPAPPL